MEKDQKKLWKERAKRYNQLEWVSNNRRLLRLFEIGTFDESHVCLDIGSGTGKVAMTLSPRVKEVHALDISQEMLDQIDTETFPNIIPRQGTASDTGYDPDFFDRITARLIFHHILDDDELDKTLEECYRILKPGGRMIISEGVPPTKEVKDDFTEIFSYKEERRTFLEDDIKSLMEKAGFKNVKINIVYQRAMSVNNWLDNDGTITDERKQKIIDLHRNSTDTFKKAYDLKDTGDDLLIDIKIAKVVGEK